MFTNVSIIYANECSSHVVRSMVKVMTTAVTGDDEPLRICPVLSDVGISDAEKNIKIYNGEYKF